ncbi:MAG: hypothetical protein HGA85_09335, partial [Nanoarchaeota archaeon]|nr:hypothetical protein [Nanoarchaeota archaeon]
MISDLPVVIGASYNKERKKDANDDPLQRSIEESLEKSRIYYSKNGRTNFNKILRFADVVPGTIEGIGVPIDVNKNNFPIYGQVSSFMFEVIRLMGLTERVAVVGSEEVGIQVEAYKAFRRQQGDNLDGRLVFAHEGERLSLLNTVLSGAYALKLGEKEQFLFTTGDVPFADYRQHLTDHDLEKGGMIIDFCGYRPIWGDKEPLFPRNWYQIILQGEDTTYVKEPNAFVFVNDRRILDTIDIFYREKRSQGVTGGQDFFADIKEYFSQFPEMKNPLNWLRIAGVAAAQVRPSKLKAVPGVYLS